MNYLISRHQGAVEWLDSKGFDDPILISHATVEFFEELNESDMVFGTLPMSLACEVCGRGARFFNLDLAVPAEYRGKELTSELMDEFGAKLTEYRIYELGRRTIIADFFSELRVISRKILQDRHTVGNICNVVRKVYQDLHPEKYTL